MVNYSSIYAADSPMKTYGTSPAKMRTRPFGIAFHEETSQFCGTPRRVDLPSFHSNTKKMFKSDHANRRRIRSFVSCTDGREAGRIKPSWAELRLASRGYKGYVKLLLLLASSSVMT